MAGSMPPGRLVASGADLDPKPRLPPLQERLGLVHGDCDEPGTEPSRVADGPELPPGDGPGGLHGVSRDGPVTADRHAHAVHFIVVGSDDAREGGLVTGSRRCQDLREVRPGHAAHRFHTPKTLGWGRSVSGGCNFADSREPRPMAIPTSAPRRSRWDRLGRGLSVIWSPTRSTSWKLTRESWAGPRPVAGVGETDEPLAHRRDHPSTREETRTLAGRASADGTGDDEV